MTARSTPDPQDLAAATVAPGRWQRRTTLRDGTAVLLRQIRPQDRDRRAAGLRELAADSRYLRFHEDLDEFTAEQLTYLTEVDHIDHEAMLEVSTTSEPGTNRTSTATNSRGGLADREQRPAHWPAGSGGTNTPSSGRRC